MDVEEAESVALALARRNANVAVAIRDDLTVERVFGWMFFWGAAPSVEEGSQALIGNAPIIVDRSSGKARLTGTAFPAEWYVHAYEELGEQRFDAGEWREFIRQEYAHEFDALE